MQNEIKALIDAALLQDVDLTEEEYREKNMKADQSTNAHGVVGQADLCEERRAKRIQMNYYGTSLNILLNLLATLQDILASIQALQLTLREGEKKQNGDE